MKTPNTNFRKRIQGRRLRGSNLMDTVATLAVVAVLLVLFLSMQQGETDRIAAKNTADKLATIGEAAKGYLSANYSKLLASAPTSGAQWIRVGRTSVGGAVPANSLQAEGFLPAGFIDVNGFQQNTALLVRKVNSTTLDAMLTTYGGREIPDRMLGTMAKLVGPAGGYVPSRYPQAADAGSILGIGGGWRSDTADWGAAATRPDTGTIQMTMNFDDGSLLKDYLYRNDVGNPEANRMNTDIDMNSRALNNTGKITGVTDAASGGGKAVIIGDSTTPNSLRATRDIWADRDVRATRNIRADGYVRGDSVRSDTYVQAAGDVNAGNDVNASNDVVAGNDVIARGDVRAAGLVQGNNVLAKKSGSSGGDITAEGDLTANRIDIDAKVFGSNVDGSSRQFRAAVTLGDLLPRSVAQYSYVVSEANPKPVPKPTCRGGYGNSRIMVYRQVDSSKTLPNIPLNVQMATVNGMTFVGDVAVDRPNTWIQLTQGVVAKSNTLTWEIDWVGDARADNTPRQVIAQTFCYYGED